MEINLRPCLRSDWEFVRSIRNDGRNGFFNTSKINPASHITFMAKHACSYFIASLEGEDFGFIGSVNGDVRFAVGSSFQGRRLGSYMLKEFTNLQPGIKFTAQVKTENVGSLKTFAAAGWKQTGEYRTFKYE